MREAQTAKRKRYGKRTNAIKDAIAKGKIQDPLMG